MNTERLERLYNVKSVVPLLGTTRGTVIRWINSGKLRAFKVEGGRLWRIRESELQRFIGNKRGRAR